MPGKIYVGDVGTEILIDLQEDISMATDHILFVKKPDGSFVQWIAEVHDGQYLKYVCQEGDLDHKGTYKIQPKISIAGWSGLGETVSFKVYDKWY